MLHSSTMKVVLVVIACCVTMSSARIRGSRLSAPAPTERITRPTTGSIITQGTISLEMIQKAGIIEAMMGGKKGVVDRFMLDLEVNNMTLAGSRRSFDMHRSLIQTMPTPAGCQPRKMVVQVPESDPSAMIFPQCIEVDRCGGCCGHALLECRPREVGILTVTVYKYVLSGAGLVPFNGEVTKQLEYHKSCQCACRTSADSCDPKIHTFQNCQCQCTDQHSKSKCLADNNKRWSDSTCSCSCANQCPSGHIQNSDTCRCKVDNTMDFLFRSGTYSTRLQKDRVVGGYNPVTPTTQVETQAVACANYRGCIDPYVIKYDQRSQKCRCMMRPRVRG